MLRGKQGKVWPQLTTQSEALNPAPQHFLAYNTGNVLLKYSPLDVETFSVYVFSSCGSSSVIPLPLVQLLFFFFNWFSQLLLVKPHTLALPVKRRPTFLS